MATLRSARPWGTLNALNLNTGRYVWQIPFGDYPELNDPTTGSENYGGGNRHKRRYLFHRRNCLRQQGPARSTS